MGHHIQAGQTQYLNYSRHIEAPTQAQAGKRYPNPIQPAMFSAE
jgi:hypothetical protein